MQYEFYRKFQKFKFHWLIYNLYFRNEDILVEILEVYNISYLISLNCRYLIMISLNCRYLSLYLRNEDNIYLSWYLRNVDISVDILEM